MRQTVRLTLAEGAREPRTFLRYSVAAEEEEEATPGKQTFWLIGQLFNSFRVRHFDHIDV